MKRFMFYRKEPRAWPRAILFAGLLLCIAPLSAMAQTISWTPPYMDFGMVEVGATATQTLTLTNTDPWIPDRIESAEITFDDRGAYAVNPSVPLPAVVLPGESFDIEISFTPPDISFYSSEIIILNNAANKPMLYYYPMGQGIPADPSCYPFANCNGECVEDFSTDLDNCGTCGNACDVPNATNMCDFGVCSFVCDEGYDPVGDSCILINAQTPLEMLDALIAFVDASFENGSLEGFGPGGGDQSASSHKRVYEHVLSITHDCLADGSIEFDEMACNHLNWLQLRADGGWPFVLPPDFLMGESLSTVYDGLVDIIYALDGCELEEAINRPKK